MSLNQQIENEYIEAYKSKNAVKLGVLRLLKTAIKNRLVELRMVDQPLGDEELLDVIIKQAKQRQDSIEQYTAAGRKDLADKEALELEVLQSYLPAMISGADLDKLIDETIAATGAAGPRDMGKVMGAILGTHKGRVDGKNLSAAVRKKLEANS